MTQNIFSLPVGFFNRMLPRLPWMAMMLCASSGWTAETFDIVVYGGNSGGVMAAVQARRMGKTVALIEPGKHLGGMTSGGLGWVDVGNPATIGGLGREYFHQVWEHYQDEANWKWEKKRKLPGQHPPLADDDHTLWIVEPSVAEKLFDRMTADAKVTVVRGERLDRKNGVKKSGQQIVSITMESGRTFEARMFIDATYEGDLMAAAGVTYVVGRDGNARYKETINGIRPKPAPGRFPENIDPYVVKGDPRSGLLPRVYPDWGGKVGDADRGVQAYNYRLCMTKEPKNLVPFEKPAGYDEKNYEFLFRFIEAGGGTKEKLFRPDTLPNLKTDTNNNGYISTDYVGMNWDYPEADYATRERIAKEHELWIRGFIWTMQNHPRIPEAIRKAHSGWGLAADEFTDNGHWPFQLYIREARRMTSDYVITENTAMGKEKSEDSVGLGSYHMDSHAIKLFVSPEGYVCSEGGMFVHIPGPFGISYRSIVPKRGECENLLVPVCSSATHAAYGTIRMEPVFMVLGQSSATAACLAIDKKVAIQELPYPLLRERLLADGQVLEWKAKEKAEEK
ncbi:MAG: FAD-dependent oxidoreductase [Candidatus Methylacidiphilales bacterium]